MKRNCCIRNIVPLKKTKQLFRKLKKVGALKVEIPE